MRTYKKTLWPNFSLLKKNSRCKRCFFNSCGYASKNRYALILLNLNAWHPEQRGCMHYSGVTYYNKRVLNRRLLFLILTIMREYFS